MIAEHYVRIAWDAMIANLAKPEPRRPADILFEKSTGPVGLLEGRSKGVRFKQLRSGMPERDRAVDVAMSSPAPERDGCGLAR
jgi:hypothetical protein